MRAKKTKELAMLSMAQKRDQKLLIKVSKEERALIEKKAAQYTAGNISSWLRWAAIFWDPRK